MFALTVISVSVSQPFGLVWETETWEMPSFRLVGREEVFGSLDDER